MKILQSPKTSPILIVLLLVFTASTAQAQWGWNKMIKGNGEVVTQSRDVADFNQVSVSAGITVIYEQGAKSVSVEADENLHEYIITEVKGDKLSVRRKNRSNIKKYKKMNVYVSSPDIYFISSSSGSKFKTTGEISTSSLDIECSSGSNLNADVATKDLDVACSSGSSVTLDVETEELDIDISSGSSLNIDGKANNADIDASSGSSLNGKDLTALNVEADASSAASISITAKKSIDASASSGSSVNYYGDPAEIDRSTSSGGSVSGK